jgi:hypothetical protein
MKPTEFKKLIREEIRKAISLNEAMSWDKNTINKFFAYLKREHDMKAVPEFKTDTTGYVEILMGGPAFDVNFMVDGTNLILKPDSTSDTTAAQFLRDINTDNARTKNTEYKFQQKGRYVIVSY